MAAHVYIHAKKSPSCFTSHLLLSTILALFKMFLCFFLREISTLMYCLDTIQLFLIVYQFSLRTSFLLSLVFKMFLSSTSAKSGFPMHVFLRLFTVFFCLFKVGCPRQFGKPVIFRSNSFFSLSSKKFLSIILAKGVIKPMSVTIKLFQWKM